MKNNKFKNFLLKLFLDKDINGIFCFLLSIPMLVICICIKQPAYYILFAILIAIVNAIIKKVVSAHIKKNVPIEKNEKRGSTD